MPTYSYRCTECENAFDIQQAFTDDSLSVCPQCGGVLRKVFSAVGVTFNGSGFYRTDSRKGPESGKSDAAKSGSSEGSSTPAASTSSPSTTSSSSPAASSAAS
ncbi:FmdB family zinc ribbon protein [Cryobacterium sp. BB307]|uniref:FmdB family zinc ribbon protein n=1 Tax=Cryobacterium sp. BB307 TaxID=2716317 RepID=UPI001445DA2A|nr:FmdB family zinc ribbon protein [Cryobacterium sp. BB307]